MKTCFAAGLEIHEKHPSMFPYVLRYIGTPPPPFFLQVNENKHLT